MVTGTADKTNQDTGRAQETVPNKGLDSKEGGAETKPERTYRQSEVDALLGRTGQKIKANLEAVTTERDTLKSQLGALTAEMTEAKESIATLTKEIDAMSADDPDKLALVRLRKEKEAELKVAKAERAKIADSEKEVIQWKKDQLVYTVADEFVTADGKDVDFDSFKTTADKFNLSDREGLEALAETMGLKLKVETEEPEKFEVPPAKPYSGKTDGGGKATLAQLLKRDVKRMTYQEKLEHKKALEEAHKR